LLDIYFMANNAYQYKLLKLGPGLVLLAKVCPSNLATTPICGTARLFHTT
jgi:hypothetical protein